MDNQQINNLYLKPSQEFIDIYETNKDFLNFISVSGRYVISAQLVNRHYITEYTKNIECLAGHKFYIDSRISTSTLFFKKVKIIDSVNPSTVKNINLVTADRISHVSWGFNDTFFIYVATINNISKLIIHYLDDSVDKVDKILNMIDNKPYVISHSTNIIILKSLEVVNQITENIGPIDLNNLTNTKITKRTLPGLIKNKNDELNFINLFKSNLILCLVDKTTHSLKVLRSNCLIKNFSLSKMNKFLLVEIYTKLSYIEYSDLFGYDLFLIDLCNFNSSLIKQIDKYDKLQIDPDVCIPDYRDFEWIIIDKKDHIICVKQLLDSRCCDNVYLFDPLEGIQYCKKIFTTRNRYAGVTLIDQNNFIIYEHSEKNKYNVITLVGKTNNTLFEYDSDDLYKTPGDIITVTDKYGQHVAINDKQNILIHNHGHSNNNVIPYLYFYNLETKEKAVVCKFNNNNNKYSYPNKFLLLHPGYLTILYSEETKTNSPIQYICNLKIDNILNNLYLNNNSEYYFIINNYLLVDNSTCYSIKYQTKILEYKRNDELKLSSTIHIPNDYTSGFRPILIWAYPIDYQNNNSIGQTRNSINAFTKVNWTSLMFWITKGYIIVSDCDMPVLKNHQLVEQLSINASAIVECLKQKGYTDGKNIAIIGHSYGAFMVANLLTHTDLFTTGIAMSGAYNRTLTPFGFQNEYRNLWENKHHYLEISPFMFCDKMQSSILLIHGKNDENPGTNCIQSERYYEALRGLGKRVELVLLPYEGHSYRCIESIYHLLAKMENWLNLHFN